MCSRYSIMTNPEALCRLFAFLNATPNIRPRYNAAPTDERPVIRLDREGHRELVTPPVAGAFPSPAHGAPIPTEDCFDPICDRVTCIDDAALRSAVG
jgi:putative SOS response-associated peptidase YedK